MTPQEGSRNRVLRRVGAIMAMSGGATIFIGLGIDNWICQSLGLLAALAGVLLTRLHLVRAKFPGVSKTSLDGKRTIAEVSQRPGILAWTCTVIFTLACLASFGAMYVDAAHGGHWLWPVYAAAVSGIACACAWAYIGAKMGWFIPF